MDGSPTTSPRQILAVRSYTLTYIVPYAVRRWLRHTDNAHTDNATKSHLTAEIAAGRPEKRGPRVRSAHDTHKHVKSSRADRGELLVDMLISARGSAVLDNTCVPQVAVAGSVPSHLSIMRDESRASAKRVKERSEKWPGSHSPKSLRGPECTFARRRQPVARSWQRTCNATYSTCRGCCAPCP